MGIVDLFSLLLSHGLLALAAWRLVQRADLDRDPAGEPPGAGVEPDQRA